MYWANFLHIYQPASQQPDILEAVVNQSYRPILQGIQKSPKVQLTLNVTGALLELFDKNKYHDLIDILKALGEEGRVEFTGSAKYHAFLPLTEDKEVTRQIKANNEALKYYLGAAYKPTGFFPPEMGWKENLISLIEELGFKWVILDEIAYNGQVGQVDYKKIYKIQGSGLLVFFRERRLSNLIMSAVVRSKETLKEAMKDDLKSGRYLITGMDGETFGHHRPGLEKLLFEIFQVPEFKLLKISDIPKVYKEIVEVEPINSTWASSEQDIEQNIQFLSWFDPGNDIHKLQWDFLHLVMDEFYKIDKKSTAYKSIREKMDAALASDAFWWASAKPWWSLEMIEEGAYRLLDAIRSIPNVSQENLAKASKYYEQIVSTAFEWQRSGKVRQMAIENKEILRIPFKDRTLGTGGEKRGDFYAFIEMMKKLEEQASQKGEYEKAIFWRDAVYKLEKKFDIYDMINIIDLVRVEIPHPEVEAIIAKYRGKYRRIRGGQPEQRGM